MKHLSEATTRFTFFAISHKQTAHNGSIFLPFVTLSFSTFCGSDLLPCVVCASHIRFLPAFLACSKAQNSLPASLPQQPSCTGVLGVTGSRGLGQLGTLQACPDPQLLCVATSSPPPICWEQGVECPPFPRGNDHWSQCHWSMCSGSTSGSEVERVSSWSSARVWRKGAGTNIPSRSTNPALGAEVWGAAGLLPSPRTPTPRTLCAVCFVLHHNVQPLKRF